MRRTTAPSPASSVAVLATASASLAPLILTQTWPCAARSSTSEFLCEALTPPDPTYARHAPSAPGARDDPAPLSGARRARRAGPSLLARTPRADPQERLGVRAPQRLELVGGGAPQRCRRGRAGHRSPWRGEGRRRHRRGGAHQRDETPRRSHNLRRKEEPPNSLLPHEATTDKRFEPHAEVGGWGPGPGFGNRRVYYTS